MNRRRYRESSPQPNQKGSHHHPLNREKGVVSATAASSGDISRKSVRQKSRCVLFARAFMPRKTRQRETGNMRELPEKPLGILAKLSGTSPEGKEMFASTTITEMDLKSTQKSPTSVAGVHHSEIEVSWLTSNSTSQHNIWSEWSVVSLIGPQDGIRRNSANLCHLHRQRGHLLKTSYPSLRAELAKKIKLS